MTDHIVETELSLMDQDFTEKIKDVLAAKYGFIALNEPVLHTAVANAAALNLLISSLNEYHRKQRDNAFEESQAFRDSISDTLIFFEKNLVKTIQKTASDTCTRHIDEFRIISQKQTAQIKYLIDNDLLAASKPRPDNAPANPQPVINRLSIVAGAAIGAAVTLLAVLCFS